MKRLQKRGQMAVEESSKEQHRDFEFNLRELAGSMGDFGTFFPLAVGYIAVNGSIRPVCSSCWV